MERSCGQWHKWFANIKPSDAVHCSKWRVMIGGNWNNSNADSDAKSWIWIVCFWCRLTQVNLELTAVKRVYLLLLFVENPLETFPLVLIIHREWQSMKSFSLKQCCEIYSRHKFGHEPIYIRNCFTRFQLFLQLRTAATYCHFAGHARHMYNSTKQLTWCTAFCNSTMSYITQVLLIHLKHVWQELRAN